MNKIILSDIKFIIQSKAIRPKHDKDIQADGTCTYIILAESPCI